MEASSALFQNHKFVVPTEGPGYCADLIEQIVGALLARNLEVTGIKVDFWDQGKAYNKTKYVSRITGPDFILGTGQCCRSVTVRDEAGNGYHYSHYDDGSYTVYEYVGTDFVGDMLYLSHYDDSVSKKFIGNLADLSVKLNVILQRILNVIQAQPETKQYTLPIVPLLPVPADLPALYLQMSHDEYTTLVYNQRQPDNRSAHGATPIDRLVPLSSGHNLPEIVYDGFLACHTERGKDVLTGKCMYWAHWVKVVPLYANEIYVADWHKYINFHQYVPSGTGRLNDAQYNERMASRATGFMPLAEYLSSKLAYQTPVYLFRRELELGEVSDVCDVSEVSVVSAV